MTTVAETHEVRLGIHDLKGVFPELSDYSLDTLAPLFDRLVTRFIDTVMRLGKQDHSMQFFCGSNWRVTDSISHPQGNGFIFVVEGLLIEFTSGKFPLPMRKGFDGYPQGFHDIRLKSNDSSIGSKFLEMMKGFMVRQNLYLLREEINTEIPDDKLAFPGGMEQKRFYRNVRDEYWVPNMAGGLTPEVVLMTLFEYCDAFFPRDWQPILEEIYAWQGEHKFLTLLGLCRQEDGKIVSDIFDKAIRYLLDNCFIYVKFMPSKPVKPQYGETRLRIQGNHKSTVIRDIEKRHKGLIWTPCYQLGNLLTEKFGKSS